MERTNTAHIALANRDTVLGSTVEALVVGLTSNGWVRVMDEEETYHLPRWHPGHESGECPKNLNSYYYPRADDFVAVSELVQIPRYALSLRRDNVSWHGTRRLPVGSFQWNRVDQASLRRCLIPGTGMIFGNAFALRWLSYLLPSFLPSPLSFSL